MHLFQSFVGLFQPRGKSIGEVAVLVLEDLATRKVDSPYGIHLDIHEDLSLVEEAIRSLEEHGVVRRSPRQIVVPDDGEEIPRVYVRYEFVGAPS